MSTTAGLITVAEFERMPNATKGARQELRHGEVVEMPPPQLPHSLVQGRLTRLLARVLDDEWYMQSEFPFQLGVHEVWVADIAVTSQARLDANPDNKWFAGAPELVIEVLSPSNTASEMFDRERTCLDGGCKEFWVIDPDRRQIRVSTPDRAPRTYGPGEAVPAFDKLFQVNDIFGF
jgi:Uma2 family endonuclease